MQNNSTKLFALLLLLLSATALFGQRRIVIEPMGVDAIKNFIEADFAANGENVVANTTYVLRRGATYGYQTQFRPQYTVRLVAEEGDGPRPRILGVASTAGESPRLMRVEAPDTEMVWESLNMPQLDNQGEHVDNAPIRPRGAGMSVRVEDCVIDFQRFEIMRTDAVDVRVRLINNIFSRNYQQDNWYKSGGMWFQSGNPVDTMIIHDNTYYNTPSVAFWQINGAAINYFEMTNNTFVNVGGQLELNLYGTPTSRAMIDFGSALNLLVEDNLFYNIGFMGMEPQFTDSLAMFDFQFTDSTESVVIRNNNIFTEDRYLENTPDTAVQIPLITFQLDSFMNTLSDDMTGEEMFRSLNFSEELSFVSAPMNFEQFRNAKVARWANPGTANNELLVLDNPAVDELDFFYGTNTTSFTGGTNGRPVGSSRWFAGFVSTREYTSNSRVFNVRPNFPNPARGFTNFHFDLERPASVQAVIYDMNGREVLRSTTQRFGVGTDQTLPVTDLRLPKGVYSYALIADVGGQRIGGTRRLVIQ